MSSVGSQPAHLADDDDPTGFFAPNQERFIKDIIHDLIPINSYLNRFIDTEPFQRLRDIKQLGSSSYVWPSASHSRFEHCLGVAYLARCLASHLQNNQKDLKITNRDVACVEIAGLCHDLGHGPWSHVWDGIFMPAADKERFWQHEMGSEMMFDYLVENYNIPLSDKDARFIKALISGEMTRSDPSEKAFLFDIVANKRNGLDVDKFDYIQRDSLMTGESFSFPATRILRSARVLDNQICYNIKDANQIYRICQRRFELHKHVYNHKTARAIDYMLVDALLLAEPHMKIAQRVYNPESFLRLNDHIMNEIEMSRDHELEQSRQILKRVRHRDLYRCIEFTVIEFSSGKVVQEFMTPQRILEKIHELSSRESELENPDLDTFEADSSPGLHNLTADDIIVDISMMHHGMKEHNPVDFTKFYHKRKQNLSMNAGPGDYSELRPLVHAEILFRIFTKNPLYSLWVQRGYRAALEDMNNMVAGETRPATPILALSTETSRTSGLSLPSPPASEGAGAGRKARSFGRIASLNHFTTLADEPQRSPVSNPRRASMGGRDWKATSKKVSNQIEDAASPGPFNLPSLLPVSCDTLSDLFEDTPDLVMGDAGAQAQELLVGGLKRGRGEDDLMPRNDDSVSKRRKEGKQ